MTQNNRILITGCNGFVARYFVDYFRIHTIPSEFLGVDLSPECLIPKLSYSSVDLIDRGALEHLIAHFRPTHIAHFASVSSVSQSWEEPLTSFVNNTNIFLNIAEIVRKLKLQTRILSIGSSEEYGDYSKEFMPLKESYELKPRSPYAIARVAQEMISKLYAESYGLDVVMTRSFNHIGVGQRTVFAIPSFVHQLVVAKEKQCASISVGNIDVVRDFLDVRDVVDAYYKILFSGGNGSVYNVCSGIGCRLHDILDVIAKLLDYYPSYVVDKTKVRQLDNQVIVGDSQKLRSELSWSPKISLEESLEI